MAQSPAPGYTGAMFSNGLIGFLAAAGIGTYVYNIMYKNTGGNTQTALIVAGIVGAFVWVGIAVGLGMIFN